MVRLRGSREGGVVRLRGSREGGSGEAERE